MKHAAQILSGLALATTLVAPCLFFTNHLTLPQLKTVLLAAAILWLVATPFWMEHRLNE